MDFAEIFEPVNSVKLGDTMLRTLGDPLSLKSEEDSLLKMVFHSIVNVKSFVVNSDVAY